MDEDERDELLDLLNKFKGMVHQTALEKGWWEGSGRSIPDTLFMIVSEISEMGQALRGSPVMDEHLPNYGCAEVEAADVLIRLLDFCAYHDMRVVEAALDKAEFNKTRPHRHGKRF